MNEEKLKELIKETMEVDVSHFSEEEKEYPLLSSRFGVAPYQMLVFFTRVEKEFNLSVSQKDIVEGKFNAYNDILNIINNRGTEH